MSFRLPAWLNVFKLPDDLWEKFSVTFICLLVYRAGAHIATPGVNVQALADTATPFTTNFRPDTSPVPSSLIG